ncbi:hypothetical protein NUW58_g6299 [Xylaria curta]|uniref:Uncharacterized protein n=1 Tax=Xylaria curta TaxID=42375 RepID=A0ACC1NW60_9PEZI|nr:hypothetical protein NUW58_g6299 [Xylaria curta]
MERELATSAAGISDALGNPITAPDPEQASSNDSGETQDGVRAMEAISKVWSKWGLIAVYSSIFLMAFATSLEGQVTYSVVAFATSAFSSHSLVATVYVIQGVVNAVIKPPMAKVADVFGRLEAFIACIVLYVLGYIQMASSVNVQMFAAAQILYSAGSTGLQILQQVLIADTSDMRNRALLSSLPSVPFLATTWIGPLIGNAFLSHSSWRWAYGIWAIILPVIFLPLALTLFLNGRRAKKMALQTEKPKPRRSACALTSGCERRQNDSASQPMELAQLQMLVIFSKPAIPGVTSSSTTQRPTHYTKPLDPCRSKSIAMGVWDVISDLVEAATPWSTAEAEAPAEDKQTESQDEKSEETKTEEDEVEEEAEEEEEEEEELEDPKEKLEEGQYELGTNIKDTNTGCHLYCFYECKNSKQCAPAKHHFDECVERVTNASDDNDEEKEDCVEEFFHLAHCATQCAAPKLWSILK